MTKLKDVHYKEYNLYSLDLYCYNTLTSHLLSLNLLY